MFNLTIGQHAQGTPVETLHKLVDATGFVVTVRSSNGLSETIDAIAGAAPRLLEDHEIQPDALIMSRMGMYRVFWGVVHCPDGSLAILVPLAGYDGQDNRDWNRHFLQEVVDTVRSLAASGYSVGSGGNGLVSDGDFARAFSQAHV
jgi:hypothetical protein